MSVQKAGQPLHDLPNNMDRANRIARDLQAVVSSLDQERFSPGAFLYPFQSCCIERGVRCPGDEQGRSAAFRSRLYQPGLSK